MNFGLFHAQVAISRLKGGGTAPRSSECVFCGVDCVILLFVLGGLVFSRFVSSLCVVGGVLYEGYYFVWQAV